MTKFGFWPWLIGAVLHFLIAALMIMSGVMKLAGPAPAEVTEMLTKAGIVDDIPLIAYGEIATGSDPDLAVDSIAGRPAELVLLGRRDPVPHDSEQTPRCPVRPFSVNLDWGIPADAGDVL